MKEVHRFSQKHMNVRWINLGLCYL